MNLSGSMIADFSEESWNRYKIFFSGTVFAVSGFYHMDMKEQPSVNMNIAMGDNVFSELSLGKKIWKALGVFLGIRTIIDTFSNKERLVSLLLIEIQNKDFGIDSICLQIPILTDADYIQAAVYFSPVLSVANVMDLAGQMFGADVSGLLPKGTFISSFGLRYFSVLAENDLTKLSSGRQMELAFSLERPWQTFLPGLTLEQFQVYFTASWWSEEQKKTLMTVDVCTKASLQLGDYTVAGQLKGSLPELYFEGNLSVYDNSAPSQDDNSNEGGMSLGGLAKGLGAELPEDWTGENQIVNVSVSTNIKKDTLYVSVQAQDVLSIDIGDMELKLENIYASLAYSPSGLDFGIGGGVSFGSGSDEFLFLLSAQYKDKEWGFSAVLGRGKVNVTSLLKRMFGVDVDSENQTASISLTDFEISYQGGKFLLYAAMQAEWSLGTWLSLEAGGRIRLLYCKEQKKLEGSAAAYASIGKFQCLVQADDFYGDSPQYLIRVKFGEVYVQAVYEETDSQEHILTISLGGASLGDIVLALVRMINPHSRLRLESPWDILNSINLSAFELVIYVEQETAVFWVNINKSLAGLIELGKIGLKYENGRIRYMMTGKMLGQKFTEYDPVQWDAQTGKPPSPSAQETKISYIGMGQHIQADIGDLGIAKAVEKLSEQLKPGEPQLIYDADNGFIFAADFTIKDMFRLKAAFVDPKLYGMQIAVSVSEQSPIAILNGLELELLYRKISSSVGMFSCTLTMPQKFSSLVIGPLTIVIGKIHVEIYTNGSFLIDLGFPHGGDFSSSFGLSAGIFTGKGGLYFGALKGDAVKSVPDTDKGVFSPAVLLGVGIAIGLGRSFDLGIAKGSVSLTLMAVFEGVFAVFHPSEALKDGSREEIYYRASAEAGVCGTLFLSVDFKIISISASAKVQASCRLTLESYQATIVNLDLSLEVSASIKILFIKIRFSFSFHKNVNFTIAEGSTEKAPWASDGEDRLMVGRMPVLRAPVKANKQAVTMLIAPAFSICSQSDTDIQYCAALLGTVKKDDFQALAEGFFDWILSGWDTEIYANGREYAMSLNSSLADQLTKENIDDIFSGSITITACLPDKDVREEQDGTVFFPMPSGLTVTVNGEVTDYSKNLVLESYFKRITEYFMQLNADPNKENDVMDSQGEENMPMCDAIMLDYFRMLASEIIDQFKRLFEGIDMKTGDQIEEEGNRFHVDLKEIMEEYSPDPQAFIRANPNLTVISAVVPEHVYVIKEGDTLKALEQLGEDSIWDHIADQNGILQEGVKFSVSFEFQNQYGLSRKQAAALLYVRYTQKDILYLRQADRVKEAGIKTKWECIQAAESSIDLGEGQMYILHPGDTFVRIAKMLAVLEDDYQDGEWEEFYEKVTGEGSILSVKADACINGDASPAQLFRRVYPDFTGSPEERGLWEKEILKPLQEISIGSVSINKEMTLKQMTDQYGMEETVAALKNKDENGNDTMQLVAGQDIQTICIPNPANIPDGILREKILGQAGETGGMLSRFFLQGLRIPAPDQEDGDDEEIKPLFLLLQQQMQVDSEQAFSLKLGKSETAEEWLEADETEYTLTADELQQMLPQKSPWDDMLISVEQWDQSLNGKRADQNGLESIGLLPPCEKQGRYLSLSDMRILDGNMTIARLPEQYRKSGETAGDVQISADGAQIKDFLWIAVFEISIHRAGEESCLVSGVLPEERKRLLSLSESSSVSGITVAYAPSKLSSGKKGLSGMDSDQCVIVKTSLSVETSMGKNDMAAKTPFSYSASVAEPGLFLKLLWECSVIGGGTYMSCQGMPADAFDSSGDACVYLCVKLDSQAESRSLADSIALQGLYEKIVLYDPQEETWTAVSPPGTVRLAAQAAESGEMDGLFQIMGYSVQMSDGKRVESAPVFPQKMNGVNIYLFTVPLWRIAGGDTPYSAVGKSFSLEFFMRDILGNEAKLGCADVTGQYNDAVISLAEYPRTKTAYYIMDKDKGSELIINISYNLDGEKVAQEEVSLAKTVMQQMSCTEMYAYAGCTAQVEEKNMMDIRLSESQMGQLKEYTECLYKALLFENNTEDKSIELAFEIDHEKIPAKIFQLEVIFGIAREGCTEEYGGILCRAEVKIPADSSLQKQGSFGNVLLGTCGGNLYGVPDGGFLGGLQVAPYEMQGAGTPYFYAMQPFSNKPVSRTLNVTLYGKQTQEKRTYYECDLNAWMKRFCGDLESMLSGDAVCSASMDTGARNAMDKLIAGKRRMADMAASRIIPLCTEFDESSSAAGIFRDYYRSSLLNLFALDMAAVYQSDFTAVDYCRAEVVVDAGGQFLPHKVSSRKQNEKEDGEFWMVSCDAGHRSTQQRICAFAKNIEYNIIPVQYKENENMEPLVYDSSDWVQLNRPSGYGSFDLTADFGIPHPLLLCPAEPSILSQGAVAGDMARWEYQLTISCPVYEQHTIHIRICFGSTSKKSVRNTEQDMFDILADYDAQRDELQKDFSDGKYETVYGTMADFAEKLAAAPSLKKKVRNTDVTMVEAAITFEIGETITVMAAEKGNVLEGLGAKLGQASVSGAENAGDMAEIVFCIENLPIGICKEAEAYVDITQNENLFPNNTLHTRDEFLFRTEEVSAGPLAVSLIYGKPFSIKAKTLGKFLKKIWKKIGLSEEHIGMTVDMEVLFRHEMKGLMKGTSISHPVVFLPEIEDRGQAAQSIRAWFSGKTNIKMKKGSFCFRIWMRDSADGRLLAQMRVETEWKTQTENV